MTDEEPGRIITSYDKLAEVQADAAYKPTVSIPSGISALDGHIRSFRGGNLVVVSGDEGEGKTTFARTLTINFTKQDARCLWFSYEERPDEFLAKFGDEVPYFLLPAELETSTVTWVQGRIKAAKEKYETLHAVFIDHLHYLTDEIETGNLSNDLGRICRKLKLIAIAENIVIVLVCHTNRSESSDEPSIRSLRDSGMIGKEADTVIFIWRNEDDTSCAKVAKCRLTGAKNKKIMLEKRGPFMFEYINPYNFEQQHANRLKQRGKASE